jgi:hypothetical protein
MKLIGLGDLFSSENGKWGTPQYKHHFLMILKQKAIFVSIN